MKMLIAIALSFCFSVSAFAAAAVLQPKASQAATEARIQSEQMKQNLKKVNPRSSISKQDVKNKAVNDAKKKYRNCPSKLK